MASGLKALDELDIGEEVHGGGREVQEKDRWADWCYVHMWLQHRFPDHLKRWREAN